MKETLHPIPTHSLNEPPHSSTPNKDLKALQDLLKLVHTFLSNELHPELLSVDVDCMRRGIIQKLEHYTKCLTASSNTCGITTSSNGVISTMPYIGIEQSAPCSSRLSCSSGSSCTNYSTSYSNTSICSTSGYSGDGIVTHTKQMMTTDEDNTYESLNAVVTKPITHKISSASTSVFYTKDDNSKNDDIDSGYSDVTKESFSYLLARCDHHGNLNKRSTRRFRPIKTYKAVLCAKLIYFYHKDSNNSQKMTLNLVGYSLYKFPTTEDIKKKKNLEFSFELFAPGKKTHEFMTNSKPELEKWVKAIGRVVPVAEKESKDAGDRYTLQPNHTSGNHWTPNSSSNSEDVNNIRIQQNVHHSYDFASQTLDEISSKRLVESANSGNERCKASLILASEPNNCDIIRDEKREFLKELHQEMYEELGSDAKEPYTLHQSSEIENEYQMTVSTCETNSPSQSLRVSPPLPFCPTPQLPSTQFDKLNQDDVSSYYEVNTEETLSTAPPNEALMPNIKGRRPPQRPPPPNPLLRNKILQAKTKRPLPQAPTVELKLDECSCRSQNQMEQNKDQLNAEFEEIYTEIDEEEPVNTAGRFQQSINTSLLNSIQTSLDPNSPFSSVPKIYFHGEQFTTEPEESYDIPNELPKNIFNKEEFTRTLFGNCSWNQSPFGKTLATPPKLPPKGVFIINERESEYKVPPLVNPEFNYEIPVSNIAGSLVTELVTCNLLETSVANFKNISHAENTNASSSKEISLEGKTSQKRLTNDKIDTSTAPILETRISPTNSVKDMVAKLNQSSSTPIDISKSNGIVFRTNSIPKMAIGDERILPKVNSSPFFKDERKVLDGDKMQALNLMEAENNKDSNSGIFIAKFAFVASTGGFLSFNRGDEIQVENQNETDGNPWTGRLKNRSGFVLREYLRKKEL